MMITILNSIYFLSEIKIYIALLTLLYSMYIINSFKSLMNNTASLKGCLRNYIYVYSIPLKPHLFLNTKGILKSGCNVNTCLVLFIASFALSTLQSSLNPIIHLCEIIAKKVKNSVSANRLPTY